MIQNEQDSGAPLTGTGSREPDPQAVPALTGFDPSRDEAFWGPEIIVNGAKPEWLTSQEPYVWLKTSRWLEYSRNPQNYKPPFVTDTRKWAWRHFDGEPCIRAIRLPADHPAYARGSDRSGEAIETAQTGSTEGESAGPQGIARKDVA